MDAFYGTLKTNFLLFYDICFDLQLPSGDTIIEVYYTDALNFKLIRIHESDVCVVQKRRQETLQNVIYV